MKCKVYVKLLDEAVDVWRPVEAEATGNPFQYTILKAPHNSIPEGEIWEFIPGDMVVIENQIREGEPILVVVRLVENLQ